MDLIDLNESFAAQAIHCQRELSIPTRKFNPNSGAIALGHPLRCFRIRIMTTILYKLARTSGQYRVAIICIGFKHGVAVLFE